MRFVEGLNDAVLVFNKVFLLSKKEKKKELRICGGIKLNFSPKKLS